MKQRRKRREGRWGNEGWECKKRDGGELRKEKCEITIFMYYFLPIAILSKKIASGLL